MLSGFWPSQDQVGLLAFPGMTSATVSKDYTCPTSNPTIVSYGNLTPAPVYQIVGLSTDYKTSDATTSLNPASNVVKAVGGASGCSGIKAPGGEGTFYADAITAAQLTLTTTGRVGVQKAIIMVTDGDASASAPSQITTALGTKSATRPLPLLRLRKPREPGSTRSPMVRRRQAAAPTNRPPSPHARRCWRSHPTRRSSMPIPPPPAPPEQTRHRG